MILVFWFEVGLVAQFKHMAKQRDALLWATYFTQRLTQQDLSLSIALVCVDGLGQCADCQAALFLAPVNDADDGPIKTRLVSTLHQQLEGLKRPLKALMAVVVQPNSFELLDDKRRQWRCLGEVNMCRGHGVFL